MLATLKVENHFIAYSIFRSYIDDGIYTTCAIVLPNEDHVKHFVFTYLRDFYYCGRIFCKDTIQIIFFTDENVKYLEFYQVNLILSILDVNTIKNCVALLKVVLEVPQIEAPRVEAPQVEAPQVEAPQVEAPQVEVPLVAPVKKLSDEIIASNVINYVTEFKKMPVGTIGHRYSMLKITKRKAVKKPVYKLTPEIDELLSKFFKTPDWDDVTVHSFKRKLNEWSDPNVEEIKYTKRRRAGMILKESEKK